MAETIYAGSQRTLRGYFDVNGIPVDPTTVTLTVKYPTPATSAFTYAGGTVTQEGVGVYSKTLELGVTGTWLFIFEGTGACEAVNQGTFYVAPTGVS